MLLRTFRFQSLSHKPQFHALQSLSLLCTAPHPGQQNDIVLSVSALIKKPTWQNNIYLKSLVSHLSPHLVSRIIALNSRDIPLCLKFFKWVCNQSSYCYDIDSRIQLLHSLAPGNFWGIMHKVLVFLIKECCSSRDDILKLMGVVEEMRGNVGFRINYPCYNVLLVRLAKLDMGFIAFSVFKRISEDGFVVSGIDYMNVVNALCKNGFVQAAEMCISRVVKLGFALDVYICTSLVLGYCRAGELREAFKVFVLMSEQDSCGVNSVTYTILVHGLCEAGKLDVALKLKEEMREKGYRLSTRTYTVLIKAMSDQGLIDQAFGSLNEMIKNGCKPNVHTYTVLVDMLCREGRIEEANGMFRKMLEEGLNPGTITYNALINRYCKEGLVVSAFELLGVMERRQCKPNIRTYNELMEGLCKLGRPLKAVELLKRIISNGLFATKVTFNILIVGFCRAGQLDMAFNILHSMSSVGIEPDQFSYTAFIDSLCKMGRPKLACVFLGLMMKKGISLDEVMLTSLIHGYCKIGKISYAFMFLEGMVKDGCVKSPDSFNIILDSLSKEVKLVEENAMLGKMLKHGLVPSVVTYTILVDGLCRAGDINASLKILQLMKRAGYPPNVYTYTIVINALCQSGKLEKAENLVVEMRKVGVSPSNITYALLIKSHISANRLNQAFEILSTMFENGCQPNNHTYSALLSGILMLETRRMSVAASDETGIDRCSDLIFTEINIHHAFQLVDKIQECGGNPFDAYKFLIMGLCRAGRISEADILTQQMVEHGLTPDNDICVSVISHLCKNEEYTRSVEWIKRFVSYGCVPSFSCYSSVIVGLQNNGRSQEAEWLISDLLSNAGVEDQRAISPYISLLVKGGEPCQFFEILSLIEQIGYKERPFI
ncbi:hypothetical protein ACS0TY_015291 [Phlomoides rotata]